MGVITSGNTQYRNGIPIHAHTINYVMGKDMKRMWKVEILKNWLFGQKSDQIWNKSQTWKHCESVGGLYITIPATYLRRETLYDLPFSLSSLSSRTLFISAFLFRWFSLLLFSFCWETCSVRSCPTSFFKEASSFVWASWAFFIIATKNTKSKTNKK